MRNSVCASSLPIPDGLWLIVKEAYRASVCKANRTEVQIPNSLEVNFFSCTHAQSDVQGRSGTAPKNEKVPVRVQAHPFVN